MSPMGFEDPSRWLSRILRHFHEERYRRTMSERPIWKLDAHTGAKHTLLRLYLGAWYPILAMGGWNRRVLFIDGFAGPGIYAGGEEGSPIIAIRTLLDHNAFPRLRSCEFGFVFFEPDHERFVSLERELVTLRAAYSPWPTNVVIHAEEKSFADGVEDILASLKAGRSLAPLFAFIDPFGVSGLPLDTIRRLSAYDKAEVFINFMMNTAQRFATAGNIDHHLVDLFGIDEFTQANTATDRKRFLHDLYEHQVRTVCKFKYVVTFEMVNKQGNVSYELFYGTRHINGLRAMKDAMWKVDDTGLFRFSDRRIGIIDMFGGPDAARARCKTEMASRLAGETMTVEEIEEFVLPETPFASSHFKKPWRT
jgi:three-Cys-motif partner protein